MVKEKRKNKRLILALLLFMTVSIAVGHFAYAYEDFAATASSPLSSAASTVATILNFILTPIFGFMGYLLTGLISVLKVIAQYNSFLSSPAVTNGWKIVRDLCNMFFILILLVIAFATILRIESYNAKKLLPKLLIMAVLINFSKTICGLFIDFSQVIMLTFVNGFSEVIGGNFISMLGLQDIAKIAQSNSGLTATGWSVFGSYLLALIYLTIAIIVLITLIAVLAYRIVMLWIYIVLSPLAYLLSAFPAGQKYSGQWWSEFSKQVIVGPLLAFFIWLSFLTGSTGFDVASNDNLSVGLTEAGSVDHMVKFIISIAMLIGGLMVTQQIGGAAGSFAGKGMAAIQGKYGATPMRWGRERWDAFSSRRADERKAKAQMGGQRMFGLYKGATGSMKGAAMGTAVAIDSKLGGVPGKIAGLPSATINKWNSKNEAKRDLNTRRLNARQTGKYKDANGIEYDKLDGNLQYYRINENNEKVLNPDGAKHMGDAQARRINTYRDAKNPALAVRSKIGEEKINKQMQILKESGADSGELFEKARSGSAIDRTAAMIRLAEKEALKESNRELVNEIKGMNSSNPLASGKINDTLNKRFAHLNFNIAHADESVKQSEIKKLISAFDDGRVDPLKQSADGYKNQEFIKAIKDYKGVEFSGSMSKVAEISKSHADALANTLKDIFRDKPIFEADGDLNPFRKALVGVNGDTMSAMGGPEKFDGKGVSQLVNGAKVELLSKIDTDLFNSKKVAERYKVDPNKADELVKEHREAIGSTITLNQLQSLNRSGRASNALMRELVNATRDHNTNIDKGQLDKLIS